MSYLTDIMAFVFLILGIYFTFVILLFFVSMIAILFFAFDLMLWLNIQLFKLRIYLFPFTLNPRKIITYGRHKSAIAMQKYTLDRFMREAIALDLLNRFIVNVDARYGTLYEFLLGNEFYTVVEVKNSSPEPDGSYKHYYLRVPPHMLTAHSAVAWTFNIPTHLYNPIIET